MCKSNLVLKPTDLSDAHLFRAVNIPLDDKSMRGSTARCPPCTPPAPSHSRTRCCGCAPCTPCASWCRWWVCECTRFAFHNFWCRSKETYYTTMVNVQTGWPDIVEWRFFFSLNVRALSTLVNFAMRVHTFVRMCRFYIVEVCFFFFLCLCVQLSTLQKVFLDDLCTDMI